MYTFIPKTDKKTAKTLSVGLFLLAAVIYFSPVVFEGLPFSWLWQTVSLLLFVSGIFVLTRYVFKNFKYEIVEGNGKPDLVVSELSPRGEVAVCRVALENIERVEIVERGEKLSPEKIGGRKKFSYLPDIISQKYCAVFVTECGESLLLKIVYDERLLTYFS